MIFTHEINGVMTNILEMVLWKSKTKSQVPSEIKGESFFCFIDSSCPAEMPQYWPRSALPCKEKEKNHGSLKTTTQVFEVFKGNFTFLTSFQFSDLFAGAVTDWIHSWKRLLPESKYVTMSEQRLCSPSVLMKEGQFSFTACSCSSTLNFIAFKFTLILPVLH